MPNLKLLPLLLVAIFCFGCGNIHGYKHIDHGTAKEIMSDTDAVVLDVRSPEEYNKRHIVGAILLPIDDIRDGKPLPFSDRDQIILVYCWTGRRAEDAAAILARQGFRNVYEFGGLVDWDGAVVEGEK